MIICQLQSNIVVYSGVMKFGSKPSHTRDLIKLKGPFNCDLLMNGKASIMQGGHYMI